MSTVGFLVKTYPKISETFILEEILGLEAMGVALHLFSLQAPTDAFAHADTARVRAALTYVQPRRWGLVRALLRSPMRTARALWLWLAQPGLRWRDLRSGACLAQHLRHHGITHLHSHFISEPAAVAHAAAVLAGATFSISAHAKDIYLSRPEALRARLGAARFTVTCTEHNLAYLAQLAPPGAHVSRMYHGIDLERFHRTQSPSLAGAPLILAVGRLKQKKGFHVLIDACRVLRAHGLRFRCEIVGYGEELEPLRARIAAHGLQDDITLPGKLDRAGVIARYRAASVFALPCVVADDGDRDGIPNVMLEALAMQLPVVSTPVSGIPEILTHGRNGLLVTPNDAPALADALARLLADDALRENLGNQGRLTVAAQCCNARNLDHLRQLLSDCLASGAKPLSRLESLHAGH